MVCLCCIYYVLRSVGKINFSWDLKFSGPRSRYLVVRNRINITMNDRMETGNCFLLSISIEKNFLKKAETFAFISQQCNLWMQFKVFNEDGYFHASSRENKVKRFNWIHFETWSFEVHVLFVPFLVFGHFWQWSYKNTAILRNLYLHFARQDGQDRKKRKKITQLKWPKYQKPKDKNMGWTKLKRRYMLWLIAYFVIEGSKLKNDILWIVE